jgi:DNA polymerase IV
VFVSRWPTILHADLDAFFASVEQRDDPTLRGKPVIVGGGVVLAASYEARAHGVRGAMGGGEARRLCPRALVVPPRWSAYVEASRAVFAIFRETAPVVEGISIDEAFLDVSGLERITGTPPEIAQGLRREVREEVGLPITVGVATTKHLAKVASAAAKPDGLLVVPIGGELAFLHPLPVEGLWGVGPATSRRLQACGIATVGDAAALDEAALVTLLGRAAGRMVHALAHNRDPRRVQRRRARRAFGAQSALGRRRRSAAEVDSVLVGLVDRVTRRMRAAGRVGRTVMLRLRFDDFSRATRSHTMPRATAESRPLLRTARALLRAAQPEIERRGLTLVGISIAGIESDGGGVQLKLPLDEAGGHALDAALDAVRERFGPKALTRAALLGRDPGLAAFLEPGDGGARE